MEDKEYRREVGLVLEDVESVMEALGAICDREESDISGEDEEIPEALRKKAYGRVERLGALTTSIGDVRSCLEDEVEQG